MTFSGKIAQCAGAIVVCTAVGQSTWFCYKLTDYDCGAFHADADRECRNGGNEGSPCPDLFVAGHMAQKLGIAGINETGFTRIDTNCNRTTVQILQGYCEGGICRYREAATPRYCPNPCVFGGQCSGPTGGGIQ